MSMPFRRQTLFTDNSVDMPASDIFLRLGESNLEQMLRPDRSDGCDLPLFDAFKTGCTLQTLK